MENYTSFILGMLCIGVVVFLCVYLIENFTKLSLPLAIASCVFKNAISLTPGTDLIIVYYHSIKCV